MDFRGLGCTNVAGSGRDALESALDAVRAGKRMPGRTAGDMLAFVPIDKCAGPAGPPPEFGPSNLPPPIRQPTP